MSLYPESRLPPDLMLLGAQISSVAMRKWKLAVPTTHVNGISSHYKALKVNEEPRNFDSDDN